MMLKTVNIRESFVLFILSIWMMADLWTRPLRFTDEVIPDTLNRLLLIIFPLLFLMFYLSRRPLYFPNRTRSAYLVAALLGYLTVHTLFFLKRADSDAGLALFLLASSIGLVLMLATLSLSEFKRWHRFFAHALLLQAFLLSIYGLAVHQSSYYVPIDNLQILTLGPLVLKQLYIGELDYFVRIASLTNNPNTLAAWLTPGGSFAFIQFHHHLSKRSYGAALLYGGVLLVIAFAMLLTYSQTGIYSLGILLLLASVLMIRNDKVRKTVTILYGTGLALVLASLLVRDPGLIVRVLDLNGRGFLWRAGLEGAQDMLVFGHGIGSSEAALDQLVPNIGQLYTFHSSWIVWLYELGLVGLLLYMAAFALVLWKTYRYYQILPDRYTVFLLIMATWLVLLQFSESVLARPGGFLSIWFSLIVFATLPIRRKTSTVRKYPTHHEEIRRHERGI